MANPRNTTDFEGLRNPADEVTMLIDNSTITYDANEEGGSAQVGLAVSLSAARTLQLAGDGEAVIGKLWQVEKDLKARVQVKGFMALPAGAGATLTRGFKVVGDLDTAARGYIREAASGTAAELNKGRGMIIDAADTAAVWVLL